MNEGVGRTDPTYERPSYTSVQPTFAATSTRVPAPESTFQENAQHPTQKRAVWISGHNFCLLLYYLKDQDVVEFLGERLQLGADHFAGPAPGGEEVDHDQLLTGIGQLRSEVVLKQKREMLNTMQLEYIKRRNVSRLVRKLATAHFNVSQRKQISIKWVPAPQDSINQIFLRITWRFTQHLVQVKR